MSSIKYTFIGNLETGSVIGTNPQSSEFNENVTKIFSKFVDDSDRSNSYGIRNKINEGSSMYFFMLYPTQIFILAVTSSGFSESKAYAYLEDVHRDNIYNMIDGSGKFSKLGQNALKNLVEKHTSQGKLDQVNSELTDIIIGMKDNVGKVVSNIEKGDEIEKKADRLKTDAEQFNKHATELKRATWWQNMKLTIILIGLVLVVILIIVLPIAFSGGDDSPKE